MPRVPLNDLSRIDPHLLAEISSSIHSVMSRGWFLKGPETAALESAMSRRFGGRPVLSVANGTDALYLALAALGVTQGSRVATVANAGGYTTSAVLGLGAQPVFIDVDPITAQMSASRLAEQVDLGGLDAVVMTHLYGLVGEIEEIAQLCREHGIPLVEDCAQALGAKADGLPAGTFGDVATTSFYPTKNLGGFGDGGAVICGNEALKERVAELAQYGWSDRYVVSRSGGINSRLDEIQAVVLSHMEPRLDADNAVRRSIVHRYADVLNGERRMIRATGERFIGHLAILVTPNRQRDIDHLTKCGVDVGIHYPVLDYLQPGWAGLVPTVDLPASERLSQQILTLPCFPTMTVDEIARVAETLQSLP